MSFLLDGHRVETARVHVPARGPWFADVVLEGAPDVAGRVTLQLGRLRLSGTVDSAHAGVYARERRVRIVGGGGGWATLVGARAYHNDTGVRARTVVDDVAAAAGETLGSFHPEAERVGTDYVRQGGPASRVLEDVVGAATWWIDYDGQTHVGERAASAVPAESYEILDFDPRNRVLELGVDDAGAVTVGSVLSGRLDEAQTVRELCIQLDAGALHVRAWTGGDGHSGRLQRAFGALVRRETDSRLFGRWRYRAIEMDGDRVVLQALSGAAGLPDILPVSMWPGVAGAHAELVSGAEVLVEFVEGDRTQPIVTHFAGRDGAGWEPVELVLAASSLLHLTAQEIRLGEPDGGALDAVALASAVNSRLDDIALALDSLCGATPTANDGGATLQTAVKGVWGGAVPGGSPTPAANVGSATVRIDPRPE